MLRPYHPAQGRRKVGPYEVHLAAGRGGIRAEPVLFNAIRLATVWRRALAQPSSLWKALHGVAARGLLPTGIDG
jgi:hypothetical protein